MEASAGTSEAALLETLISRGWRFRDSDEISALISSKISSDGNRGMAGSLKLVELELLNMDLRSFGGQSLPEPSVVKKLPYLQGPIILQVASVRDVCQSRVDASFRNLNLDHRLLRFILTDGRSGIVALEYGPIPSITEEIIPGTKVRLENKIAIRNGLLCLTSKVVTVLGGLVQSLYEEWQMSQKYAGLSGSTFRQSHNNEGARPPPFEKLHLESYSYQIPQQHSSESITSYPPKSSMGVSLPSKCDEEQGVKNQGHQTNFADSKANRRDDESKNASIAGRVEDKPSSSEARPKEVIEAVPILNQAAAQKLLQKMSQSSHECRYLRGPRYKGKNKQEEEAVFTLDEWERRKLSSTNPMSTGEVFNVSNDEEFARQLQNQLDLEDSHVKAGCGTEAEQIRSSMFSFGREEERNNGRRGFRGRGRSRGRGRGRGRSS